MIKVKLRKLKLVMGKNENNQHNAYQKFAQQPHKKFFANGKRNSLKKKKP